LLAVNSDELSNGQRSFFQKAMADWPGSKDLYKQSVALRLAIFKELSLPEEKRDIQFSSAKLQDSMLVDKDYWEKSLNGLLKTLKPMGGVDSAVLKQKFGGLLAPLIDAASQRGLIKQWKNYYMINHEEPQKHISPFAASLLEELLHNPQGLSPSKCKDAEQNQYQMMFRMGLIRMSKDMICHEVQYQEACSSLKELLKGQGEHEIDWIKEHCEYSRRQLINYLFWMEEDGEVVNRDNCRSVV
ncbi:MAG: hypothetical protein PF447_14815, partial [Spirochaetaceae bacterium]|nr:hypothetical protein [Spirochaetaceae bacterium]